MSHSQDDQEQGDDLIQTLLDATGLPKEVAQKELENILEKSGHGDASELTLDQLRAAMIEYLESISSEIAANVARKSDNATPQEEDSAAILTNFDNMTRH